MIKSRRKLLPPNVSLAPITAETLPSFRRLNSLLLPVPYSNKFYAETISDHVASSISLVALWHDTPSTSAQIKAPKPRVVGGIRCRLLAHSPASPSSSSTSPIKSGISTDGPSLYISTISVLAPYRHHGIATALLAKITARAICEYGIQTVSAHVWEANEEAREWYRKMGFREVRFEDGYYKRLKPAGAWTIERRVGVGDLLGMEEENGEKRDAGN
jgi:N-alpha-acetyltransferase 50